MAMSYYKTFRVPYWVILGKTSKNDEIIEWFKSAEAKIQKWPSEGFKEKLLDFKNKGWAHIFSEKNIVIPPQLLSRAMGDHIHETMTPFSQLDFLALHRLDRTIRNDADYDRLFNDIVSVQEPIILSQMFQVAETCFSEYSPSRPLLWLTQEPCERSVISKIADNVITIGEGSGFDLNVKSVKKDKLDEFLSKKMVELYKLK